MATQAKPDTNVVWASGPFGRFVLPSGSHQLNGWGAEIPEYDEFNGIIWQLSAFNQHVNLNGVPVWDEITEYPLWGVTKSPVDGNIYRATAVNKNIKPVNVIGGVVAAAWARISFTLAELSAAIIPVSTPPGMSAFFAQGSAPAGWLKENGAAVSRTAYAALFAAIGTTYGAGDGVNTFNVPDSRARFKRPLDDGKGIDTGRGLGSTQEPQNLAHTHTATSAAAGAHTHTATAAAVPDHIHATGTLYGVETGGGNGVDSDVRAASTTPNTGPAGGHTPIITVNAVADHTHAITVNSSGGAEARPSNIAFLSCIKY